MKWSSLLAEDLREASMGLSDQAGEIDRAAEHFDTFLDAEKEKRRADTRRCVARRLKREASRRAAEGELLSVDVGKVRVAYEVDRWVCRFGAGGVLDPKPVATTPSVVVLVAWLRGHVGLKVVEGSIPKLLRLRRAARRRGAGVALAAPPADEALLGDDVGVERAG